MDSDTSVRDRRFQLQHLLLARDPVLQSQETSGASDEYLDQLSPIVKQALDSDTTDDLIETLQGLLRLKDREIEAICSGNHNKLDQVSAEADTIKSLTADIGARIAQSGQDLADKKTFLEDARRMRINIDSTIEAMSSSLEVLNRTNKVHQLLKDKNKFEAFKALEDLRSVQNQLSGDFGFAKNINKSVPQLARIVRSETVNDFGRWVGEVDQMNMSIGRQAFDIIQERIDEWKQIVSHNKDLKRYKFNSPVEQAYRDSSRSSDFSKIKVDFSPLYECVLVHSSLGLAGEFRRHFESDRKVRSNYLIPPKIVIAETTAINSTDDSEIPDDISEIKQVIQTVAGFCIVDRLISRSIPSLRPFKEVDDLWESLNQKLSATMANILKDVTKGSTFKDLKSLWGSFLYTMQSFGFNTGGVERVILSLFQRYSLVLKEQFKKNFFGALAQDDSMPMSVRKPDMYKTIIDYSWYKPDTEANMRFPITLPFSEIYPLFCMEIRSLLTLHQSFLSELQNDPTAIEDILNSAVDDLLVNTVCKTFEDRLKSSSREEIIQILINLEYFQNAANGIELALSEERISGRRGKVHLQAPLTFATARKKSEERIYELLNNIIDDFLDLADYHWTTTKETDQPSSFLLDMVTYLKTLFTSTFAPLPGSVKAFIYLEASDHLSSALLQFLLEAPSNTSLESVHNFDVDVKYLTHFLDELSLTVADQKLLLTSVVEELRQSVDLLLTDNVEEYNDSAIRAKKYSLLKPEDAKLLASKISEARMRQQYDINGVPTSNPNSPNLGREGSPRISSSSKFMKYYRHSVEKKKNNAKGSS